MNCPAIELQTRNRPLYSIVVIQNFKSHQFERPLSANSGRCRRTTKILSSGRATDDVISLLNWDAPLYNERLVNQASLGRTAKPKSKPSKE